MKKKLASLLGLGVAAFPMFVFAANSSCDNVYGRTQGTIEWIICRIGNILNTLIPILVVAGVAFFIWGVVSFVIADDEEAKSKGRNRMIWGIVGLAVIVAMWGLVNILLTTFLPGGGSVTPVIPCVPGTPGC